MVFDLSQGPRDVITDDPVVGHEYLEASHDDVDVDAGGRFGDLGFGEVELDAAHDAGDVAAPELLGAISLVGLTHRDGYVEVAFGTCSGFGPCLAMFPPLSSFLPSPSAAVVAGATGNDGNADEDDRDRPDIRPPEHVEQHELNDRRDGDHHDWARGPLEPLHDEQIEAPQDEQGRDVEEELADAVYGDRVQRHEQQQHSDNHYENPEEYAAFHVGLLKAKLGITLAGWYHTSKRSAGCRDALSRSHRTAAMAYYLLIEAEVLDASRYAVYREAVTPVIAQYGGRFLVRGGEVEVFEGEYNGRRRVVIEFDSKEAARGFWDSPEYAPIKKLREGAGIGGVIGVEGV